MTIYEIWLRLENSIIHNCWTAASLIGLTKFSNLKSTLDNLVNRDLSMLGIEFGIDALGWVNVSNFAAAGINGSSICCSLLITQDILQGLSVYKNEKIISGSLCFVQSVIKKLTKYKYVGSKLTRSCTKFSAIS